MPEKEDMGQKLDYIQLKATNRCVVMHVDFPSFNSQFVLAIVYKR